MNAIAVAHKTASGLDPVPPQPMSRRGVIRAYLSEAMYESVRMLRAPGFTIPFLSLPLALYLLFGVVLYGADLAKDPQSALFVFMGFSIFGVMGPGMFGFGIPLAMEREQGLLKLKYALPVPPAAPLLAKMAMSMLFVTLIMITMAAAAPIGHLHLTAWQVAGFMISGIAGCLPFCAMGLFIGSIASAKGAPAIVNLLYLPMIYLSGILFPLPASMHWVEIASPAYHLAQATRAAMKTPSQGAIAVHIAVLVLTTLIFTAIAMRRLERAE
jgi:ABC-2 type transport system permease protein